MIGLVEIEKDAWLAIIPEPLMKLTGFAIKEKFIADAVNLIDLFN